MGMTESGTVHAISTTPSGGAEPSAYQHPLTDRRQATRQKRKFVTQMTPWAPGHASVPFEVVLEDISETGVGIIHGQPLEIGLRHLLTVPREGADKPIMREYTVARCDRRTDGTYAIGLEVAIDVTRHAPGGAPAKRVTSSRVRMLLLAFGFVGLFVAAFYPM
jgi:hypothetical protein